MRIVQPVGANQARGFIAGLSPARNDKSSVG
jgi:hypothetical protein